MRGDLHVLHTQKSSVARDLCAVAVRKPRGTSACRSITTPGLRITDERDAAHVEPAPGAGLSRIAFTGKCRQSAIRSKTGHDTLKARSTE